MRLVIVCLNIPLIQRVKECAINVLFGFAFLIRVIGAAAATIWCKLPFVRCPFLVKVWKDRSPIAPGHIIFILISIFIISISVEVTVTIIIIVINVVGA